MALIGPVNRVGKGNFILASSIAPNSTPTMIEMQMSKKHIGYVGSLHAFSGQRTQQGFGTVGFKMAAKFLILFITDTSID
jgi:hypothetical protein